MKIQLFAQVDKNGSVTATGLKDLIGKPVRLTIEPKIKRSLNQNSFYFGNFIESQIECFKERFGETYRKEQIHEFNKNNFWGSEQVLDTGEIIKIPCSSTGFSKLEWEEKLDTIRQWFRQNMDWELGYPNQQNEMNF